MAYKIQSLHAVWEDVPEGDFPTEEAAVAAMEELERNLGWRDLRVVDEDGNVVAEGLDDEEGDDA